jgi:Putative transposase/Transposase zinc-binding domain
VTSQGPLKRILAQTRSHWDRDGVRPEIRHAFRKALECRTATLGAEVFASEDQELIVYHTCKSPACTSCGHRANTQWQRERWAALPDVKYKGITFTMPKELWGLFRDNRPLADALPALAASVLEAWMSSKYELRVGVMAVLHTFNGSLEFNSHVHTMVSAGGLRASAGVWVSSVYYDKDRLMQCWRSAVLKILHRAHFAGLLRSEMDFDQLEEMLRSQADRWWSIKIQSFRSSAHFLGYAGRYVRRPPIAQRRITYSGKRVVSFWTKDKKLGRRRGVQCTPEEFIDLWAQHIPKRYKHAVRYFGLFAPRAVSQTTIAVFRIIGQTQRPRPKRRRWADSLKRDFGRDPLVDRSGQRMGWVRRLAARPPT